MPRYERDDWFGDSPASMPRTLVIPGTLDPDTPYAGAQAGASMLGEVGRGDVQRRVVPSRDMGFEHDEDLRRTQGAGVQRVLGLLPRKKQSYGL